MRKSVDTTSPAPSFVHSTILAALRNPSHPFFSGTCRRCLFRFGGLQGGAGDPGSPVPHADPPRASSSASTGLG